MQPTAQRPTPATRSSRTGRLLAALALTASVFIVSLPTGVAEATPPQGYSREQVQLRILVNATRADHGLRPLTFHQVFANKAQTWAEVLADCRCLAHRRRPYGAGHRGWYAVAEDVGRGRTLSLAYAGELASPLDRAHIVTSRFTHIGTGVARATDGRVYIVVAFMDRTP